MKGVFDRRAENRREIKEFLVMVSLGLPALGFCLGGFKLLEAPGGHNLLGSAMIAAGGILLLATGAYHYLKDYSGMGHKRGLILFLVVTTISATAGLLAASLATKVFVG